MKDQSGENIMMKDQSGENIMMKDHPPNERPPLS